MVLNSLYSEDILVREYFKTRSMIFVMPRWDFQHAGIQVIHKMCLGVARTPKHELNFGVLHDRSDGLGITLAL